MDVKPHFYAWITSFLFFWKCCQVNGSQTKKNTWETAVLDCFGSNSFLESNVTILKKYMGNNTEVNSIWVGSFEVLLPWIEIRGCYNIPLTCNNLDRDEMITADQALCQLKCMKRRYFAFNPAIRRCVCFDEQNIVKKESLNASHCNDCSLRGNCNIYVVAYKVLDMSVEDNAYDCLSYQCESQGAMPKFNKTKCTTVRKSYCRDGGSAFGFTDQPFLEYNRNCQENNFKYPLLHSENPVNLCDLSQPNVLGVHIWVGVYRQRLVVEKFDETVLQAFKQISKFIYKCQHLTMDDVARPKKCDNQLYYICTSDNHMDLLKDQIQSSALTPVCHFDDSAIDETDNKSSGMIVGIVLSISVIVLTILVILAFMYRRTYAKEQLSLNTAGREDRSTIDMDNNTVISDYQQLDNVDDVQKMTQAYDQLHIPCIQTINDQANTSFSRQEYNEYECIVESNGIDTNTVISEYEELYKAEKDTSTQPYDQLNVTHVVKTEPTSFFFKTNVSNEKHSKNESTKATTVTIEYEQLDYAKKDKSMNVYDQLHVTDIIDTDPTNYNSKTTISRDQQSKDEPTEETTDLNNMTVTSEYEQLDNAKKDKSVNVYDQLHGTDVMDNDPTQLNPCQGFKEKNI